MRDGEVPVVIVNAKRDPNSEMPSAGAGKLTRPDPIESALRAEQSGREQVERTLQQALATIHSLQTRLAHAEMAHSDALAAERRVREQAEQAARQAVMAREEVERRLSAQAEKPKPARPARRRAKAPATASQEDDAQPIEWWVPGWRNRIQPNRSR